MTTIEIKSQEEFDKLPESFEEYTGIRIVSGEVVVRKVPNNSTVTANGNSRVHTYSNSTVTANGNSRVRAANESVVRVYSEYCTIETKNYVTGYKYADANITHNSKVPIIEKPVYDSWFDQEGLEVKDGKAVVFKRVSKDLKTQEGTENETVWTPGTTLEIKEPDFSLECGEGKYKTGTVEFVIGDPDPKFLAEALKEKAEEDEFHDGEKDE